MSIAFAGTSESALTPRYEALYFYAAPDVWNHFGEEAVAERMVSQTSVIEGRVRTWLTYQNEEGEEVQREVILGENQQTVVSGLEAPSRPSDFRGTMRDILYFSKNPYRRMGSGEFDRAIGTRFSCEYCTVQCLDGHMEVASLRSGRSLPLAKNMQARVDGDLLTFAFIDGKGGRSDEK